MDAHGDAQGHESAREYTAEILSELQKRPRITSDELGIPPAELHGALLSLQSHGQIVFSAADSLERVLTAEGREAVAHGSQEYRLYVSIGEDGSDLSILEQFSHGSRHAFKNQWIRRSPEGGRVLRNKSGVEDETAVKLANLQSVTEKEFAELKKRNLVSTRKSVRYAIGRGPSFGITEEYETELTAAMVQQAGNTREYKFKRYNFESTGNIPSCGALHPLLRIREEFKRIFLEMGFQEMETGRYVESSFWNFDSLFQPQNHPSRDAHDTFFLSAPASTGQFDEAYLARVEEVHSRGGYGSLGHSAGWSREEASKNILRTHTTSVSSRYLKQHLEQHLGRQPAGFRPVRLFSIDKVFRNESIDATHLAEFHQVEGLVAGHGLSIGDLTGMLSAFFERLGLKQIRFKPAFNPYTEPSMEVFGFHEGLGRWIEIGNSGIFRPEMLGPMGYPEDVSVIAWGLSLERPAMIKYGLNNIRDLIGHKVDINFVKKSPFIFF